MKCPKCNSNNINQYRMLTGPIWCEDCGFRTEQKEKYNPFLCSGEKNPVQAKEFPCGVSTFFCISDDYKNQIRIPVKHLRYFQVQVNKEIEKALDTYDVSGEAD